MCMTHFLLLCYSMSFPYLETMLIVETESFLCSVLQVSPLNDIEKILDCEMRPTAADDTDASNLGSKQIFVKQYLVKWKGLSYLHCSW